MVDLYKDQDGIYHAKHVWLIQVSNGVQTFYHPSEQPFVTQIFMNQPV